MSRKKVGLALSGGGARGFAHVGVLKVLAENEIPVDLIAGTSIGSLVGGAFAAGMSATEIEEMARAIRWRHIVRPSLSPIGLLSNAPMGRLIKSRFPISTFEETAIPFAAVVCDLASQKCISLKEKGDMVAAIRASCAVPAVFTPIRGSGGSILVDGGVMAPLPIDAVKEMGADVVIAVDLLSSGTAFQRTARTAFGMMFNSAMVLVRSASQNQIYEADVSIVPQIAHIRFDRLSQSDECMKLGERAAREMLGEIRRIVSE